MLISRAFFVALDMSFFSSVCVTKLSSDCTNLCSHSSAHISHSAAYCAAYIESIATADDRTMSSTYVLVEPIESRAVYLCVMSCVLYI